MDPTNGDDQELIAYLDGELDAAASQRVEQRLARDAEYRSRLRALQRTWDMLDLLPQKTVSEKFAQSTVEMVATSAAEEAEISRAQRDRRRPIRVLVIGGVAAAALLAGYLLVSQFASRENDRLAEDLPVIENFELYRHTGSLEFLRQLDEEGLFAEEVDDAL